MTKRSTLDNGGNARLFDNPNRSSSRSPSDWGVLVGMELFWGIMSQRRSLASETIWVVRRRRWRSSARNSPFPRLVEFSFQSTHTQRDGSTPLRPSLRAITSAARSVTSRSRAIARVPISSARERAPSPLRCASATRAPAAARSRALAQPIPETAPVMNAGEPVRSVLRRLPGVAIGTVY